MDFQALLMQIDSLGVSDGLGTEGGKGKGILVGQD